MRLNTKRILTYVIPIIFIITAAIIITLIVLPKKVTTQTYYNSLNNSNYTKQEQITTITDGTNIVYEKLEVIIFDGEKVYQKITEKTLSTDINEYFDETTLEYYYSKDKMFYKEDGAWKSKDFKVSENLRTYNLKDEYFSKYEYEKDVVAKGSFKGTVKDQYANTFFGYEVDFSGVNLVITIDFESKIQSLNISAKTETDRDVSIKNTYSYDKENVELPQ